MKAAQDISQVNSEVSYEAREVVYKKYRMELTAQFRYDGETILIVLKYSALFRDSKKNIPNTCRGFF